ncbi:MAG: NPCBM/NEW2 domain-containing protein [Bacteroidales bacterium]
MKTKLFLVTSIFILMFGSIQNELFAEGKILHISLQTRDPKTNQVITKTEDVDASKIGVVIVDPWNFHWCMTACERVSAMVPRWNKALEVARKMGMPIIWCPSDVIGSYSGYPQRERVLGVKLLPVPKEREMLNAKFTALVGMCMCGPGFNCIVNFGWDGMNLDLYLADNDFIASSTEEVYTLLKNRDITHVIYMGLHTNVCLYEKPGALKYMWQAGLNCMLARDINDAITSYNPATGFTPDNGTQQTDEDLELAGIPTINVVDEWRKAGLWDDKWIVETVRITPWGKLNRPYFFKESVTVTLTTPLLKDAEIHYTLDGSKPKNNSPVYKNPLTITSTTSLQTAAFRAGKLISIPTDAYFVLLPPEPPKPNLYLDDLDYIMDPYGNVNSTYAACLWLPKRGKSYENQKLRVRGKVYEKGLGFRAPSAVRYELKPEYERFVAKVDIDDNLLDHELGRNLVMHCSVVFRVFIDGKMMAESPIMRISQEPWRFDVKIPQGSRYINLVCMDAGSRNILDLGNWVDAGFCVK